jgi:predicted Zn-dependent protease
VATDPVSDIEWAQSISNADGGSDATQTVINRWRCNHNAAALEAVERDDVTLEQREQL